MAAVTACTQVAGTGVVAMADEIIVEAEPQEYAGEAGETALAADVQQADETADLAVEPSVEDAASAGQDADGIAALAEQPSVEDAASAEQTADGTAALAEQPDEETPAAVNDAAENQASDGTPSGDMNAAASGTVTEAPAAGEAAPDMVDETSEQNDDMIPADGDIAAEPDDAMVPADGDIAAEPDDAVAPSDGDIGSEQDGAVTAEQPGDVLLADELNIDGGDLLMSVEEIDGAEMAELDLAAGEGEGGEEQRLISFTGLRDEERHNTWIFDDEEQTIGVDTSALEGQEYALAWSLGIRTIDTGWDDPDTNTEFTSGEGEFTVNDDGTVTLHGNGLEQYIDSLGNDKFIGLRVQAFDKDGQFIVGAEDLMSIDVRRTEYNYWCSANGATLMPGWTCDIEMWCGYQDAEHPDGEETTVPVTNVAVQNVDWNETIENEDGSTGNWVPVEGEPVIVTEGNEQDGWMLRGEGVGAAQVTLTYTPVNEGDADSFSFVVFGSDDLYTYEWLPMDHMQMLADELLNVSGRLSHEWYYDEENQGFEWVDDYSLELDPEREYDTDLVQVSINADNPKLLEITSYAGRNGETDIPVRVKCGENYVADASFHISVCDDTEFYGIAPKEYNSALPIGGFFDLNLGSAEESHVHRYYRGSEIGKLKHEPVNADQAGIRYTYEYDENAWRETGTSGSDGLPVLQRTGDWDTKVTLIAQQNMAAEGEEEDWQEICRYPYRFDSLKYDIWFEGEGVRSENGDGTWIYNTEDLLLNINMENLAGKESDDVELTYEYKVGLCEEGRDDYVKELSDAALTVDGGSVTLHGDKIWKEIGGTELPENQWLDVSLEVYANGVLAASCGLGMDVWKPKYDYQCPDGGVSMLPGWDHLVDRTFNCYVENGSYPHGKDMDVTVTNVSVANAEDEESELPVCMIDGEDENGWNIHANQNTCGHAVATVTYELVDGSGDSGSYEFDIWVGGDVFNMNLWSDSVSDQLLPGENLQMTAQVWHDYYDNEKGHDGSDVDDEDLGANVQIDWMIWAENGRLQENEDGSMTWIDSANDGEEYPVLTLKPDGNGRTCTVTAADVLPEEWGDFDVRVEAYAYVPNAEAEGGREELAANDYWITVTNGYWQLMQEAGEGQEAVPLQETVPSELVVGETVKLNPVIAFISQSGEQPDTEGLRYRLEWDQEAVQIMAESVGADAVELNYDADVDDCAYSNAGSFTVIRQNRHATHLNLIAELPELDEDGNECYYEATRCEWQLDELNYDIGFENPRGDGYTWIFTDEDYGLKLNVGNVADRLADDKYALDVTVGVYEETEDGVGLVEELAADTAAADCYQVSGPDEKGMVTVMLHGAALAEKVYGDGTEGSGLAKGQWLELHASLLGIENADTRDQLCYDDGTPIDAGIGLDVLEPMLRLEDAEPGYMWLLLGGGYEFDGTADKPTVLIYPQNQKYPNGDQAFEAAVSAIEITNPKNEDGSEIEVLQEVVSEENGAKFLYANECGQSHMTLKLSCPDLSQEEIQMELDVEVGDRAYEVNLESSTGTENLLKGASLELQTSVYLLDGNAEGENRYTEVSPENYSIEYCDYDQNLIQVEDGVVTAVPKETNENYYGTDVKVQVSIPQDGGGEPWIENRWFHIEVCEQYCVLQASPLTAGAGDELTPDQFDPKLYMINEEHPEVTEDSEPLKNVDFWFDDSSDWGIASFNDERTSCVVDTGWEPGNDRNVQIYIGGNYMDAYGDRYKGFGMAELTVCGHQIQKTEAVKPTCTKAGNVEYYYCEKCDRYFGDEACMEELDPDSLAIAAAGHKLTRVAAKAATCTTPGNVAYYHCSVCNKNYSDAAGTKELSSVTAAAKGHKLAKVAAKAATCTTAGNIAYYHCSVCNKNYSDAAGTKAVSNVTVAAAHKLAKVAAKPATCTAEGNVEHYHCSVCSKNYSDAAGTKALSNVKVAAGHKLAYVAATTEQVEHYHCSVCGKNFSDKSGTAELTSIKAPAKPAEPEKPTEPEKPADPVTPPEAHTHTWGEWTTVSVATVFAPEQRQHTCGTCGVTETQAVGAALTPTMTVPANSLKMRVKQKTKKFVVTDMAEGDSVASMVSSSTKRLKVVSFNADGTCTLKAGKKTGKAKLTITLASGLTKTITFKIQKAKVKTTSVKVAEKKLTLKKGEKLSLKPLIRPITSQDKVTYTSSSKRIVTVSSKGKLTAKKAGKAKITIRSGKKKVVCTVTVTN